MRLASLAAGIALVAFLVLAWRLPRPDGVLGADVKFVASPTGELQVSSPGVFLSGLDLEPGGRAARGELIVRNVSGVAGKFSVRGLPSNRDLDRPLHVELSANGRVLAHGSLASIRRWTRPVKLPPRGELSITARAWLPRSAGEGWKAHTTDVTFELRAPSWRGAQ
jgi:hypothetical protein